MLRNNHILRRLKFIQFFDEQTVTEVFALGGKNVGSEEVVRWLKNEDELHFLECEDTHLEMFLNGLIIYRRGSKDGPPPQLHAKLNNNVILRKLKIAFALQDADIIELLQEVKTDLTKYELTAFFRKNEHKNFRKCKNSVLNAFLGSLSLNRNKHLSAPLL